MLPSLRRLVWTIPIVLATTASVAAAFVRMAPEQSGQIDPTMASAMLMLRELGNRLRELHVSEVGPRGEHLPLGATTRQAFARIVHLVPPDCPLIIESIIPAELIESELDAVSALFDAVATQAAIA